MGRPLNAKWFAGDTADKIVFHAWIKDAAEKCYFVKQTGFNRYVVKNADGDTGVITLVNGESEVTEAGFGYLAVTDKESAPATHYVRKLTKLVAVCYDDSIFSWGYDITTQKFTADSEIEFETMD